MKRVTSAAQIPESASVKKTSEARLIYLEVEVLDGYDFGRATPRDATLEATQGQILGQSPADATSGRQRLNER